MDFHSFLFLLSPSLVVGVVALVKNRWWLGLVRHIYDRECESGRTIDPIALLEAARNGASAASGRHLPLH